jgi:hypothetical protein
MLQFLGGAGGGGGWRFNAEYNAGVAVDMPCGVMGGGGGRGGGQGGGLHICLAVHAATVSPKPLGGCTSLLLQD